MPRDARLVQTTDLAQLSMSFSEQADFPARFASLPDTAAFARGFCDRHGIGHDDALKLTLIIEELFTNTIEHGYRAESDAPIRIGLASQHGAVALLYEDSAPPYDPLSTVSAQRFALGEELETRPIGGLGVHLVRELTSDARYTYEDGSNRLWLTLKAKRG
jgi:serine/threonine-protein kinase RsbW